MPSPPSGEHAISISRFAAYATVGAVGTAAQYLILIVLVQAFAAAPVPASLAGYAVGAAINYWLNHRLTFRSEAPHRQAAPRFLAVAGLGFLVNAVVMQLLVNGIGLHYLAGQVVATGLVLVMNYLANAYWTFRHG
jgi:putative flippase GtrA